MEDKQAMDTILKQIFNELGFTCSNFSEVVLNEEDPASEQFDKDMLLKNSVFAKNNFHKSYYLILFIESNEDLERVFELENHYFYLVKEFFNEPEVDRNTSMVICLEGESIRKDLNLKIEESPYYFKKYIFTYQKDQLTNLLSIYLEKMKEIGYKKTLDNIISDKELFREFKEYPNKSCIYGFVSQLFIKFPALNIEMSEGNSSLQSLSHHIDECLQSQDLYRLKEVLLEGSLDSENIEELSKFIDDFLDGKSDI